MDGNKLNEQEKEQSDNLILQEGNASGSERIYSEFHFGENEDQQKKVIKRLIAYALMGEEIMKGDNNEI